MCMQIEYPEDPVQNNCTPCVAGQTRSAGGSFLGLQVGGGGTATINGTTFTKVGYSGNISPGGNSFVVPSSLTSVTITVPFTFTSTLKGVRDLVLLTRRFLVFSWSAVELRLLSSISPGSIRWEGPSSSFSERPSNSRKFPNPRQSSC